MCVVINIPFNVITYFQNTGKKKLKNSGEDSS